MDTNHRIPVSRDNTNIEPRPPSNTTDDRCVELPDRKGKYTKAEMELFLANYPEAFADFYGTPSRAPCVYKTGPVWPAPPPHPGGWGTRREMRPVYDDHPIASVWDELLEATAKYLDASSIPFSAIAGFGMANKGEAGVLPCCYEHRCLTKEDQLRGGEEDKPIIEYRYQFSSTPSLNMAPLAEPDDGGTASLYFRLDSDSDDVFLLTAAHVVCPPSSMPADKIPSQVQATTDQIQPDSDANKVISLDVGTYSAVSQAISCAIDNSEEELKRRENEVEELREVVAGAGDSERKDAKMLYYAREDAGMLQQIINLLWELNSQIIEFDYSNVQNRVIGTVIHADPIGPGPTGVTLDWAAIKIDHSKFNWSNFGGNRVYIGEQIQLYDWYQLMHPNHHDGSEGYHYPVDGLLEVNGVVPEHELHRPNALNTHNERGMPVVKNGRATCTTFGWVNGLKTLARHHIKDTFFDSRELTIIPYSYDRGAFSGPGDSGSAVFDKRGRVVGMITSATKGVNEYIDLTYATPFHELDSRIKEVFPRSSLYPAVNGYY
ncbi:hypothetical protein BKA70DRAFT_1567883 [Coprinopsis sp. MPI-PUGE-AT-0042]|nr:hypothetical protein BKA70DRAFT_1567883 [Coprinopsis sp. MPI-PUGE-AT-0042]